MRLRKVFLSPAWLAFTLLALVVAAACLALGWWQWTRFESIGGTFQNLGYTIQWPFFSAFAIYLWWRFLRESERPRASSATAGSARAGSATAGSGDPRGSGGSGDQGGSSGSGSGSGDAVTIGARQSPVPARSTTQSYDLSYDEESDPELAAYNRYLARLDGRSDPKDAT